MAFKDMRIDEFSERLASPDAVPGGGGTSALAGALAASLGNMSGALTVGKKKYAPVEDEIRALMIKAGALRERLLECIDLDAEMFEPLSKAYSIPKGDPEREAVMEECLKNAASAPLEIFDLCCEVIALEREFSSAVSPLVVSDAATGAALAGAAMCGAALNVKVNTKLMKDREYAERLNAHIDEKITEYKSIADEAFNEVYGRFC